MKLQAKKWKIVLLAGLLALLVSAGFLSSLFFKPNAYKGYLQTRLSENLDHPVRIDQLRIGLFQGVRLRMIGFTVMREEDDSPLLQAREVSAHLKLLPLIRRRIVVDSLRVEQPQVRLRLDGNRTLSPWVWASALRDEAGEGRSSLAGFPAKELVVKEGVVVLRDESDPANPVSFEVRGISAFARFTPHEGLSFVRASAEVVSGQHASAVHLKANIDRPNAGEPTKPLRVSGHLRCENLYVGQYWKYLNGWVPFGRLEGRFDVESAFTFNSRGHFETSGGNVRFTNLLIDYPKAFRTPFAAPEGKLRWEMSYDGATLNFPLVDLDLGKMKLQGHFAIDHLGSVAERSIEVELSTPPFPLRECVQYLPTALLPEKALAFIEDNVSAGALEIRRGRLRGKILDIRNIREHPDVLMAELAGAGFSAKFSEKVSAEGLDFSASLEEGMLKFRAGAGSVEGLRIKHAEGRIEELFSEPVLVIQGSADVTMTGLREVLPKWISPDSQLAFLLEDQDLEGSAVADVSLKRCLKAEGCSKLPPPDEETSVTVSGKVGSEEKAAALSLEAKINRRSPEDEALRPRVDGRLRLEGLHMGQFWRYFQRWIPFQEFDGRLDVETNFAFDGRGHFKTTDGTLRFTDLLIDYPKAFRTPFTAAAGSLRWEMAYDGTKLDLPVMDLDLNEIKLRGQFRIDEIHSVEERSIDAEFSTAPFLLPDGARYFPSGLLPEGVLAFIEENVSSGSLEIRSARIAGKVRDIRNIREHPEVLTAELVGEDFSTSFSEKAAVAGVEFGARLEEGALAFHVDAGTFEEFPIRRVDGRIGDLFMRPVLELQAKADIPLEKLQRVIADWIPDDSRSALLREIEDLQGSAVADVSWKYCWTGEDCKELAWALDFADLTLKHSKLGLPVEQLKGHLEFGHNRISVSDLEGVLGNSSVRLSMDVEDLETKRPTYTGKFWADLSSEDLPSLLGTRLPQKLQFEGSFSINGSVQGRGDTVGLELNADLTEASYEYVGRFRKPAGKTNSFSLVGSAVNWEELVVDEALFTLGGSTISASGTVKNLKDPLLDLSFLCHSCELADFSDGNPYWKPSYPVAGRVSGEVHAKGPVRQPEALAFSASADLDNVAVALPGMGEPGVIRQGKLQYAEGGLELQGLDVNLGRSSLRISGRIAEWDNPRLVLQVQGDSITLEDFSAHKGNGGDRSDTDLVKKLRLDVQLGIDEVHIKHMTLQDLRAHLTSNGEGVILTKDISFSLGGGEVTAQASIGPDDAGGTRVDITDLEAKGLEAKCFIDPAQAERFFLTGILDANAEELWILRDGAPSFLAGVNGEFQFSVEDGTLKRSRVLATIFSIMNLHKTLRPGFPDLKGNGLKFKNIRGTVSARDGVFSTSDLLLDSNAVRIEARGAINLRERQFEGSNDNKGMRVLVQPFYTADNIISQISKVPFVDFVTGDNVTLFGALFEVSGPLGEPKVRPVDIRSLEAGPRDRLKNLLQGSLRRLRRQEKKEP